MTTNCPVVISFDFQHEYDRGNNMYFHLNLLYFRKRITFHHNNSALSLESISKWQMWRRYFSIKVAWISRLHVIRGIGMKEWEMKTEGFKQTLTNLLFVHNASCNTHPPALLSAPWRISQSRGNTSGRSTALKEAKQSWTLPFIYIL